MPYVNNSPEHRKPLEQVLRDCGIALKDLSLHRQYTTCPKCSLDRKKKRAECLAVTIEDNRVHWFCNHCGDKGAEFLAEKQSFEKIYYNYTPTLRKVRLGKTHKPPFVWEHRDGTEWKPGTGGQDTKTLLLRIDGCKAAIVAGKDIASVEGEKDAETLWSLGIPATCNAHGAGKWTNAHAEQLKGAKLVVLNDNDKVGIEHAEKVFKLTKLFAASIRRADMKTIWPDCPDGGDVTDYVEAGHDFLADWERLTATASDQSVKTGNGHTSLSDDEVEAMAAMSPIELAKTIKDLAAAKDVPQAAVKAEYKSRKDELGIAEPHKRRRFEIPVTEPFDQPVNGELLGELATLATRYLVLPKHGDTIVALWTAFTYAPRLYRIAPRLQITAPEKRCGKTTLLNFLHEVADRRIKTGNISTAAFFRVVEGHHPTLLIDEMDTFMNKDEDIRNVLNEGHEINGCVIRCEKIGDNFEPVPFSCFAPVAYAHIGKLPKEMGTLLDRSIAVHLVRRMAKEKILRLDQMNEHEFLTIRRKLKRWSIDHEDEIKHAMDNVNLSGVNDRVRDNWRPLLAVAKVAGGDWFDKAIAAITNPDDEGSIGEMWLKDMRNMFDRLSLDFIVGVHVCANLNAMEDRPWSEMGYRGSELSPKGLAKIAREFDVKARHDTTKSSRGYYRSDLEPLWERYLDNAYEDDASVISPGKVVIAVQPIDDTTDKCSSDCCPENGDCCPSNCSNSSENPDDWSFNNDP